MGVLQGFGVGLEAHPLAGAGGHKIASSPGLVLAPDRKLCHVKKLCKAPQVKGN